MISRFVLVLTFIVLINLGCAALQVSLLQRRKPWPKWLGIAVFAWSLAMIGLTALQAFSPPNWQPFLRDWFYLPLAMNMIWSLLFLEVMAPLLILLVLLLRRIRPVTPEQPMTPEGISRRRFLYLVSYGAVPTVTVGMAVHGTLTRNDLRVNPVRIPIANLPPELEGFTIAHVSDLHAGLYVGPERLKKIHNATNDLKPDLILITGDIINTHMSEFPEALAAIQGMESRYGTYICEGNHDLIPGPTEMHDACRENNLALLYNSNVILPVEGRRVIIGGLPWLKTGFEGKPEIVSSLYPARQEGDVRVLMAHHPHLFDIAESADIVLSGHTHGGQIMLTDQLGLGPLFFKYWSGLYRRGNTTMIVSNGSGDWFPCRIGAPAEIGLLRLTRAVG